MKSQLRHLVANALHSPMLVEAFPAAQLRHWGLVYEGYSGSTQELRRDIVNA